MKGSHSVSLLQGKEKYCYVTKMQGVPLHKHHIFFGTSLRKVSDKNGFWVWLIPELHNMSSKGVHFNKELDLKLKQECQKAYEEDHSREDFIKLTGKNYL